MNFVSRKRRQIDSRIRKADRQFSERLYTVKMNLRVRIPPPPDTVDRGQGKYGTGLIVDMCKSKQRRIRTNRFFQLREIRLSVSSDMKIRNFITGFLQKLQRFESRLVFGMR